MRVRLLSGCERFSSCDRDVHSRPSLPARRQQTLPLLLVATRSLQPALQIRTRTRLLLRWCSIPSSFLLLLLGAFLFLLSIQARAIRSDFFSVIVSASILSVSASHSHAPLSILHSGIDQLPGTDRVSVLHTALSALPDRTRSIAPNSLRESRSERSGCSPSGTLLLSARERGHSLLVLLQALQVGARAPSPAEIHVVTHFSPSS